MPGKFLNVYNLLLVGSTGAGKSTFINSISNFFLHETLKDALADTLPSCVIHSQFTLTFRDSNRIQKSITVSMPGVDRTDHQNEGVESDGVSCTLEPRVYSFSCKGIEFNIIDLPGLASTDGFNRDQINKQAIIRQISSFEELHGICIVVTANTNRLTTEVKYCLDEIMSSLNKSAIENLMFIVTYFAQYNFTPGMVATTIKEYLDELNRIRNLSIDFDSNVFCIDNEAFRFIIGWNQSIEYQEFCKNIIRIFEESWSESREAVFNLLKKIYAIKPYRTECTMAITKANTAIECVLPVLDSLMERIAKWSTDEYKNNYITSFVENRTIEKLDIQTQDKDSDQLIDIRLNRLIKSIDAMTRNKNFDFSNCYHQGSHLEDLNKAKLKDPVLEQFQKIGINSYCRKCSHYDNVYKYNNYEVTKTTKANTGSKETLTREAKKYHDLFLRNLKDEKDAILSEVIILATFLKENAILKYNTALEEQILTEIRYEELKGNCDAVQKLNKILDMQKQKKTIINRSEHNKVKHIGVADVENSLEKLFTLPICGRTIKTLFEKKFTADGAIDLRDPIRCNVKYIPEAD